MFPAALVKNPAKQGKAGQAARDAVRAAAKQRRTEKQSAKPELPPWDNYNRKGRQVADKEIGDSDEDASEAEDFDEDLVAKAKVWAASPTVSFAVQVIRQCRRCEGRCPLGHLG